MARTRLSVDQINWQTVFTVSRTLAARGFKVKSQKNFSATLLASGLPEQEHIELMFHIYDNPVTRNELRLHIKGEKHDKSDLELFLKNPNLVLDELRFTTTLEWYFGEMLVRKYQSFSSAFGVELQFNPNPRNGKESGDYDVLSVMGDGSIFYIECKSGGVCAAEIIKATDRGNNIFCTATVITLGHKTNFGHLEKNLNGIKYPGIDVEINLRKIALKDRPSSEIFAWHNTYFLPRSGINAKEGMDTILRLLAMTRVEVLKGFGVDDNDYDRLGFVVRN
jgi:hypothetical protein